MCRVCLTHLHCSGTIQLQRLSRQYSVCFKVMVRTIVRLPRRVILLCALAAAGLLRGARALPLRCAAIGQHRRLLPARMRSSALCNRTWALSQPSMLNCQCIDQLPLGCCMPPSCFSCFPCTGEARDTARYFHF